ncbi:hypothetical protein, partial [Mesorhizobium sp. M1406]|uniref:hypothetical protein n=1 Tax=Mesorhizobium sp. M1406 TaxID=2957099 RepID=UPI003339525D
GFSPPFLALNNSLGPPLAPPPFLPAVDLLSRHQDRQRPNVDPRLGDTPENPLSGELQIALALARSGRRKLLVSLRKRK